MPPSVTINQPNLYPLALQPVLVSLGTSPRVVEGGEMTDSDCVVV